MSEEDWQEAQALLEQVQAERDAAMLDYVMGKAGAKERMRDLDRAMVELESRRDAIV